MSQIHRDDPVMQALCTLPRVEMGAAHAATVRARCRAQLEHPPQPISVPLEPATVGTVCAIYAWEIVRAVIR